MKSYSPVLTIELLIEVDTEYMFHGCHSPESQGHTVLVDVIVSVTGFPLAWTVVRAAKSRKRMDVNIITEKEWNVHKGASS